ncbi:hypothetical protein GCM10025794_34540 [Massilia kyonggiensis]
MEGEKPPVNQKKKKKKKEKNPKKMTESGWTQQTRGKLQMA